MKSLASLFRRKKVVTVRERTEDPVGERGEWVGSSFAQTNPLSETHEFFDLNWNEVHLKTAIGKTDIVPGVSQGFMFRAEWNAQDVILKCFMLDDDEGPYTAEFVREAELFSRIRHPNIVHLHGAIFHPPFVGILTEFSPYGDLFAFLVRNPDLPLRDRFRILFQVAAAVDYLHQRHVIHRDLKLHRILIDQFMNAKLIDFGLERVICCMAPSACSLPGNPQYMAPEIMEGHSDEKVDVYSFSIIMYQMLTNRIYVFGRKQTYQAHLLARRGDRPDLEPLGEICPARLLDEVTSFVQLLWHSDPTQRPAMSIVRTKMESLMDVSPDELIRIVVKEGYVPGDAMKKYDERLREQERSSKPKPRSQGASRRNRKPSPQSAAASDDGPGEQEPSVRVLLRHSRMIEDFTLPYDLKDLTMEGLRNAFQELLGLDLESISDIRMMRRGRQLRITKDATVGGLVNDTILVAILPEEGQI